MTRPRPESPPLESFWIEGFRGVASRDARLGPLDVAARRAADPASAGETLHWGRNYVYSLVLEGEDGPIQAVAKLFRNQGWWRRLERRVKGSKAERSWSMALALRAAGLRTPEPLLLLESELPEGPSIFVSRRLSGVVEARYLFRALRASTLASDYPWVEPQALAREAARTARALHDAGFWHRDLSIGNLLVGRGSDGGLELNLIDLNRTRRPGRLSVGRRTRDLCRLGFHDAALDRLYVDTYWAGRPSGLALKRALYRLSRCAYLARVEGKNTLRGSGLGRSRRLFLRKPHAHIPAAPAGAGRRDKAVWDELSDQPHQHASRSERLRVRLADSPAHLRALGVAVAAAPRVRRRYRELLDGLWSRPVDWPGVGVGIGPRSGDPESLVAAIAELGVEQVLIRLHPWEEDRSVEESLARALAERHVDLVFALPQVRDLVRDAGRWRAAVAEIGGRFLPYGRRFQIGQAINRSKWGLWNYREYVEVAAVAAQELRALGEVELLGPAVIDFEPHAMAAALNYPGLVPFDTVSGLLYVDRRGAPENRQLGFDAIRKTAVMRAIGETARAGAPRYWVTEFNWPLREGPHSPAGRSVAVDEEAQASYLVRYCVGVLGSGLAERAYWWQLAARGYGLLDPAGGGVRRRPGFRALATLLSELRGARCTGPVELSPRVVRAYGFVHPEKGEALVAWSRGGAVEATLPRIARRLVSRDGVERRESRAAVRLTAAPAYLWLDGSSRG